MINQYPSKTFKQSEIKDLSRPYLIWGSDYTKPAFLGFNTIDEAYVYIDLYCDGWYHRSAYLSKGVLDPRPRDGNLGDFIFHYLNGDWHGFIPSWRVNFYYESHIQEFPYMVKQCHPPYPLSRSSWYAKNYEEAEIFSRDNDAHRQGYSQIIHRSINNIKSHPTSWSYLSKVIRTNYESFNSNDKNVWLDKRRNVWRKEFIDLAQGSI